MTIPSALIYIIGYIIGWILGIIFAFGIFAAIFTWLVVRGGSDDYEPIENGGDDE